MADTKTQPMSAQGMGMSAVQSGVQAWLAQSIAESENSMRNAVIEANNQIARSGNAVRLMTQGLNNQRAARQAARDRDTAAANFQRGERQRTMQSFQDSIRDAEQVGAIAAAAGRSGYGQRPADAVLSSTLIRQSMRRAWADTNEDDALTDQNRLAVSMAAQAESQQDHTTLLPNQTVGQADVAGSAGGSFLLGASTNLAGNMYRAYLRAQQGNSETTPSDGVWSGMDRL